MKRDVRCRKESHSLELQSRSDFCDGQWGSKHLSASTSAMLIPVISPSLGRSFLKESKHIATATQYSMMKQPIRVVVMHKAGIEVRYRGTCTHLAQIQNQKNVTERGSSRGTAASGTSTLLNMRLHSGPQRALRSFKLRYHPSTLSQYIQCSNVYDL